MVDDAAQGMYLCTNTRHATLRNTFPSTGIQQVVAPLALFRWPMLVSRHGGSLILGVSLSLHRLLYVTPATQAVYHRISRSSADMLRLFWTLPLLPLTIT